MRVQAMRSSEAAFTEGESCLVVPVYEDERPLSSESLYADDELVLQALLDKDVFGGKAEQVYYLPTPSGRPYQGVLLLGLGTRASLDAERVRRGAGAACGLFKANRVTAAYLDCSHHAELPAAAFVEGVILGQYDFDAYKSRASDAPVPAVVNELGIFVGDEQEPGAVQAAAERAALIALAANGARHLGNTPANEMTPRGLAAFAEGIAAEQGCECTVLEERQLASLGMNALLGVSLGSAEPPRLIVLRYHHSDAARTLAIVGKGVTFDTGGISIKPGQDMHEMKFDMCGAAAVLGAMLAISQLKPAVNVVALIPATENKIGPAAQVPGDIVRAYNGKTIEILNTDAEGRLILADAMAFAVEKYHPDAMVDLATLTGACVVALGHHVAGGFTNDPALLQEIVAAGERSGDRVWPMPLWPEHEKMIEGIHADIANIGPRGDAGAITAAAFLKHFVGTTPWVHLDIAGTAWDVKNVAHLPAKHATGYGVRLLTEWICSQGQ